MAFLKKLFKKKPGGTLFGNALRGAAKLATASGLVPGAGLVAKLLPDAPPLVVQAAQDAVSEAVTAPALNFGGSFTFKDAAAHTKQTLLNLGASLDEATKVGAVVYTAASLEPAQAVAVLDKASAEVNAAPVNSFGAGDIKKILNGAVDGARDGATSAYLNETETGKAQKKGAINAEGAKIMPWALLGAFGVIGLLLMKRN